MAEFRPLDQATGLRRLLGASSLQVLSFVSGREGVGRSVVLANLAVSLARLGKEVLIIDEHSAADDVASSFGIRPDLDLLDVLSEGRSLAEVLLHPQPRLSVLPAARATARLGQLTVTQQAGFLTAMQQLPVSPDIILIDVCVRHPAGLSPFALASQEVVVVLAPNIDALRDGYALIKRTSQAFSRKQFRLLFNKVTGHTDALRLFEHLSALAQQRSVAQLHYAGCLPLDERVSEATERCVPVLDHAPGTPVAVALNDLASELLFWRQNMATGRGVEEFVRHLLHLSQRPQPRLMLA